MSEPLTPEQRIEKLEGRLDRIANFCAKNLLLNIHKLDKAMAANLLSLARAVKDPAGFDLDEYEKQINRADAKFDQVDAALADAMKAAEPSTKRAKHYRWRGEVPDDVEKVLNLLPKTEVIAFSFMRDHFPLPDLTADVCLLTMSLEDLIGVMRQIEDGHVMLETVQPVELYTGERDSSRS